MTIRWLVTGILGTLVLVGCSTTTSTTISVGYAFSPIRTHFVEGTISSFSAAGSVEYEIDRGQQRLGACVGGGPEWSTKAHISTDGSETVVPYHGIKGAVCQMFDVGDPLAEE